jgi:hypothetical protein
MMARTQVTISDDMPSGMYTSKDSAEAIHERGRLLVAAVRHGLQHATGRPAHVLNCDRCLNDVVKAARQYFDEHATPAVRRVTFHPARKK